MQLAVVLAGAQPDGAVLPVVRDEEARARHVPDEAASRGVSRSVTGTPIRAGPAIVQVTNRGDDP